MVKKRKGDDSNYDLLKGRASSKRIVRQTWSMNTVLLFFVVLLSISSEANGDIKKDLYKLTWSDSKDKDGSPISLTASDGTGLELVSLKARAVVLDPLSFTELHIVFHNPEDRVREGRFEIALPPGAALSRFAMKIGQKWQEAEVVERQAARRAYEDFLHRRQDPALLEKKAGNQFRARVFPIPANSNKEFIVSFSSEITGREDGYKLMIGGLPKLRTLDVDVLVNGIEHQSFPNSSSKLKRHVTFQRKNFKPIGDLEMSIERPDGAFAIRNGHLMIARVKPKIEQTADPIDTLTVLFDTSASRAPGYEGQVDRLKKIIEELNRVSNGNLDLTVACFDQSVEEIFKGKASDFDRRVVDKMVDRKALGASNLKEALKWLATSTSSSRALLFTDGISTAGNEEDESLSKAVAVLNSKGIRRLDAIVDGGIRDEDTLETLVGSGLEKAGVVIDASEEPSEIAKRLNSATLKEVDVQVDNATWVWPRTVKGLQADDDVLVFATMPPQGKLSVRLVGTEPETHDIEPTWVPRPLLERAFARAEIKGATTALMEVEDPSKRKNLQNKIIKTSLRHRVLSDYTALLVLETERDYERFGINRHALSDILTISKNGALFKKRTHFQAPSFQTQKRAPLARQDQIVTESVDLSFPLEEQEAEEVAYAGGGSEDWDAEEEIVVTGTRIGSSNLEDYAQITVLGSGGGGDEEEMIMITGSRIGRSDSPPPFSGPLRDQWFRRNKPTRHERDTAVVSRDAELPFDEEEDTFRTPRRDSAHDGRFARIMRLLKRGKFDRALSRSLSWRDEDPGNILAIIALGESYENLKNTKSAMRAYGSIIDLFPSRADMRRMAGERLERLGKVALPLILDTYKTALKQRPDHPSSYRLYAFALLKAGHNKEAFLTLLDGIDYEYPSDRFMGVKDIMLQDLGLLGAAWIKASPSDREFVLDELFNNSSELPTKPSTRFVLNWETDANDVDLHVFDNSGNHAYFRKHALNTGGSLIADVTTGYGPECFVIDNSPRGFPYTLQAHYYRRGPMGYGMGKLQVVMHDGNGNLEFTEHPFVVMKDNSYITLAVHDRNR